MKKQLTLIALAAITLFSCGGGTTQNNGAANDTATANATDTVQTPQCDVSTDILTEYAVSILKDHLKLEGVESEKITNECEPFNNHPYAGDNFRFFEHEDGNFSMYWYLYFYPKKSGGYEVIVEITGAGGDAYEPIYNYEKFICQDDKITKAENIVDMKITDFYSNFDKFPKAAIEAIETAIKEHPDIGIDGNKITASFNPWYWEGDDYEWVEVLPKPLEGFEYKEGDVFPSISYIWNGESFVPDPKNKPLKEDLIYFEGRYCRKTLAGGIATKLKIEKAGPSSKESCDGDLHFTMNDDCEGYFGGTDIYCFPRKDENYQSDGWFVIEASMSCPEGIGCSHSFNAYIYDGKNLTPAELPVPSLDNLLDFEKCKGRESEVEKFKAIFDQRPRDFIKYEINFKEKNIKAVLYPLDIEKDQQNFIDWELRWKDGYKFEWYCGEFGEPDMG